MLSAGFFFFKQKTAYVVRISDWGSDVCSSDLVGQRVIGGDEPSVGELAGQREGTVARSAHAQHWIAQALVGHADIGRDPQRIGGLLQQIGRAPCRERVCQYV